MCNNISYIREGVEVCGVIGDVLFTVLIKSNTLSILTEDYMTLVGLA